MITPAILSCGVFLGQFPPGALSVSVARASRAPQRVTGIAAKDRATVPPVRGESMRHYLRRVSARSGVVFACPESCLAIGTAGIAGTVTPFKVAQILAKSVNKPVLVSGDVLIIPAPRSKEEQCRTDAEIESCRNACNTLAFADSFTRKQLDLMVRQGDRVTLDQLTPYQQKLFWKADSKGDTRGLGYISQGRHIPFAAKNLQIGICRTKSLRLWNATNEPLSWYGIYSHTSQGLINTNTYGKKVVSAHPPVKARISPRVSDAAAYREVMTRCKTAHALNIDTGTPLNQGVSLIRRHSKIPLSVDARYKTGKPFVSVDTLPADRWLQASLLFTGLNPRRTNNTYTVTRIQMGKYLLDNESRLSLIDSLQPALSARYRQLAARVSAKLNRLPYPQMGIPFQADDFVAATANRKLYRMSQLTPEQQAWIRWFAHTHPDRSSEYDHISFPESRLELKDTLWIYGRVTQPEYTYGFSEMLTD